jgi:ribonuclease HI
MGPFEVFTDASFCQDTRIGSWALVIKRPSSILIKKSGVFIQRLQSSVDAERFAALCGIHESLLMGASVIKLHVDCLRVIHDLKNNCIELKNLKKKVNKNFLLELKHIKGHTFIDEDEYLYNQWCDQSARKALRLERNKRK